MNALAVARLSTVITVSIYAAMVAACFVQAVAS